MAAQKPTLQADVSQERRAMAQLDPTHSSPSASVPEHQEGAGSATPVVRTARRTFRPGLGALRLSSQRDVYASTDGAAADLSGGHARGAPPNPTVNTAHNPRPKFGEALAAAPSSPHKKTQAAQLTSHLNPWIPIPWAHQVAAEPTSLPAVDIEAQALAQTASLPVHRVCTSPGTIVLKMAIDALGAASIGQKVCINLLDGEMLAALSRQEMAGLLEALVLSKHTTHWHYNRYDRLSRYNPLPWLRSKTLSGTSALFLHLLAKKDVDTATRIVSAKPVEIALELGETIPDLFTLPLLGCVFGNFVPEVTRPHEDPNLDENDQLSALAVLVAAFVSVHVNADPDALEVWTIKLLKRFESSGFESTSANVGLMAGAILAGNLRYGAAIAARDAMIKKYVWFVVALAFAGLSFVPNSSIDGGLTIAAFLLGAVFDSYWPVRDLSFDINQLEGKLRTKMLKVEMFRNTYENTEMMAWIDNVKKCNGY